LASKGLEADGIEAGPAELLKLQINECDHPAALLLPAAPQGLLYGIALAELLGCPGHLLLALLQFNLLLLQFT
jgi:hypothetical protein